MLAGHALGRVYLRPAGQVRLGGGAVGLPRICRCVRTCVWAGGGGTMSTRQKRAQPVTVVAAVAARPLQGGVGPCAIVPFSACVVQGRVLTGQLSCSSVAGSLHSGPFHGSRSWCFACRGTARPPSGARRVRAVQYGGVLAQRRAQPRLAGGRMPLRSRMSSRPLAQGGASPRQRLSRMSSSVSSRTSAR